MEAWGLPPTANGETEHFGFELDAKLPEWRVLSIKRLKRCGAVTAGFKLLAYVINFTRSQYLSVMAELMRTGV